MDATGDEELSYRKMRKKKKKSQKWNNRVSLSASLPDDVCGVFAETMCLVKFTSDPVSDMRDSILEMIHDIGGCDWNQMEELIYCYLALNSPELHQFITHAFLSLI
ncbi:hypothetical protein FNV43_RR23820 [Rhamnella rubrinervis]|uniref:Transcription repressor n=1 Tax=Rhamnella rubrinervis TaxID=2594499 RepID=A0A8K0GQ62_9ROSA|nr:hypothetical protein FNV43_RR23820 [Rhamnella rubrinervis]